MTSPASKSEPSPPSASPAPATSTIRRAEKLIGAWRRVYQLWKPLETKVDAARKAVVELIVAAGLDGIDTKFGEIKLMRKDTTDWQALARSVIAPAFIEQLVPAFTKTGDPYTRAPTRWSAE